MQVDSQIRRFLILNKELDPDDGELTRTRKVRRRIVAERYKTLIEALYGEQDSGFIEIEVTFEDGRKGRISGDLTIMNCQTFAPTSAGQGSRQAAE
jgi:long-chain acyl-CoA synthetase